MARSLIDRYGEYEIEITEEKDGERLGWVIARQKNGGQASLEWVNYREVDWPDEKSIPARLAANKLHGDWVQEKLELELQKIADLDIDWDLTGFDESEIPSFNDDLPEAPEPQIERADELLEKWGVKYGDLWEVACP